jgi:hypothetical protein
MANSREDFEKLIRRELINPRRIITNDDLADSELNTDNNNYSVITRAEYFEWPDEFEQCLAEIQFKDFV